MKKIFIILIISFIFIFSASNTFARSGCCSYHNGVREDGCGCNDGTPLSSKCVPYYSCKSTNQAVSTSAPIRVNTVIPTRIITPMEKPTIAPTSVPTRVETPTAPTNLKIKINPTPTHKLSFIQRLLIFLHL